MFNAKFTEYSAHGVISHVSVTGSELGILDGSAFAGLEIQNIQLSRDQLYFISEYAFRYVYVNTSCDLNVLTN